MTIKSPLMITAIVWELLDDLISNQPDDIVETVIALYVAPLEHRVNFLTARVKYLETEVERLTAYRKLV